MVKLVTILFVVSVIGGFLFLKFHNTILSLSGVHLPNLPTKAVAGASTSIFSPQVQSTLSLLQKQVGKLSPKDISSSSPQVQAILKTLQALPQGEAHDVCQKLCGDYLK